MYTNNMTALSKQMYDKATSGYLTLAEATDELRNFAYIRTVRDTLAKTVGIPADNKSELTEYLVNALAATDPNAKKDSIARKVRTWLNGEVRSISKDGAIQLAFALGLSLEEADDLLVKLCEERFHWRNPEELVFIFAIKNNLSYQEALSIIQEIRESGILHPHEEDAEKFTEEVEYELGYLDSVDELKKYISQNLGSLGVFHNTAYSIFTELIDILMNPDGGEYVSQERVSVRDIVYDNLYSNLIPRIKKSSKASEEDGKIVLSALQKSIHDNWPDETVLSRMINRKTDITRKTLILLFLATDGGSSVYGDWEDEEQTAEEIFEDRYERMKDMLIDCGFAPLDPRSPFDWMIMYCMCTDDTFIIDSQMRSFLQEMFSE